MEIERKWLVDPNSIPYDLNTLEHYDIEQIYLCYSPTVRARKINSGKQFIMTVKTKPDCGESQLSRNEYEFPISSEEYENMRKLALGHVICKTRYLKREDDGLLREIDIFHGELQGLSYLEIEFPDTDSAVTFQCPFWTLRDVTEDEKYKNGCLAQFGMPPLK